MAAPASLPDTRPIVNAAVRHLLPEKTPRERLYRELTGQGVEVLYDDLDQRPGAKFATADLIGIPWQILVGPKGLAEGKVEVKKRADGSRELMSEADASRRWAR